MQIEPGKPHPKLSDPFLWAFTRPSRKPRLGCSAEGIADPAPSRALLPDNGETVTAVSDSHLLQVSIRSLFASQKLWVSPFRSDWRARDEAISTGRAVLVEKWKNICLDCKVIASTFQFAFPEQNKSYVLMGKKKKKLKKGNVVHTFFILISGLGFFFGEKGQGYSSSLGHHRLQKAQSSLENHNTRASVSYNVARFLKAKSMWHLLMLEMAHAACVLKMLLWNCLQKQLPVVLLPLSKSHQQMLSVQWDNSSFSTTGKILKDNGLLLTLWWSPTVDFN